MKKIILLVFAVISALFLLTACPNAAGGSSASTGSGNGTPPGEIDYAARLIGTWQTEGYDKDEFIELTHPTDSSQHCKFKGQWIFTPTTYTVVYEIKESTSNAMKNGVTNEQNKLLYGVDARYYYTREKNNDGTPSDGGPVLYEIQGTALFVVGMGPLYKK